MSEPTTIHWLTLPRNGNGGAAIVSWDHGAFKYMKAPDYLNPPSIEYLLGFKPPRYPIPAIHRPIDLTTYWLLPVGSSVALLSEYWFKWRNAVSYDDPYMN